MKVVTLVTFGNLCPSQQTTYIEGIVIGNRYQGYHRLPSKCHKLKEND